MKVLATSFAVLAALTVLGTNAEAKQQTKPEQYGFRSATEMNSYFDVHSVEVKEVPTQLNRSQYNAIFNGSTTIQMPVEQPTAPQVQQRIVIDPTGIDQWVTLGERIWKLIEANRPVANVKTQRVTVIPVKAEEWTKMEGWQGPAMKTYTLEARNGFGASVIKQTYTIAYNHSGKLDGKGAFLANAMIIPSNVEVAWGFQLDSNAEVGDVVNTATKADPIPGLHLGVHWTMKSVLKHNEGREVFFLKGNGEMSQIAGRPL